MIKNSKLTAEKTDRRVIREVENIIARGEKMRDEKLQEICDLLADTVEVFDWVGFYLVDPDADRELVLGPYVGEETEHKRIPFGTGICGQAADTHKTFVVQDVSKADNYLACSMEVKAEIVIPIMKGDDFVAELDIDFHTKNAITENHQEMLEEICHIVANIF
jgi:GAF domain-containing protein